MRENDIIFTLWYMVHMFVRSLVINSTPIYKLAQAALRAPPKVALECVAGHCYYHRLVSPPLFFCQAQFQLASIAKPS